jgi:hypothetical protein
MYPSKKVTLCLFYASEQAKVLKKSYLMYVPSLTATAFLPTSRWGGGGWVAVGGGGKAAKQGKGPFTAKIRPKNTAVYSSIVGLTDLWAFFAWTKRCGILYVDFKKFKKLKSASFWPSYDLFSEGWFCDFSWSLESCGSASSEAILNFSKDLKSPVHALFKVTDFKKAVSQRDTKQMLTLLTL